MNNVISYRHPPRRLYWRSSRHSHQRSRMGRRGLCLGVAGMLVFATLMLNGCSFFDHKKDYALAHEGTLSVVASADGAPLVSGDAAQGGELSGYSVAVAQEVARRLELGCVVEAGEVQTMTANVAQGTYDAALSLSSTLSTYDGLGASNAYYIDSQALIVRDNASFDKASDLEKKAIAVMAKTEGSTYAHTVFDEDNISTYASIDRCFEALQRGGVQAVVVDQSLAKAYLSQHEGLYRVLERIETGKRYGFIVSNNNGALMSAINEALAAMDQDGTLQRLQEEYL